MLLRSHAPGGGSIGFLPPGNAAEGAGRRPSKATEGPDHTPVLGPGDPAVLCFASGSCEIVLTERRSAMSTLFRSEISFAYRGDTII